MPLFYIRKIFLLDEKSCFLFMPDADDDRYPSRAVRQNAEMFCKEETVRCQTYR